MQCHYEVLGVERTADDKDLKKAYRKKARELHPDKNIGNEEEATASFQRVQAAYAVLSDPQERAWYDKHREALLAGGEGGGTEGVNLLPFFSSSAFSGFDNSANGFYGVYRKLFRDIIENEQLVMKLDSDGDIPDFGDASSDIYCVVKPFYQFWEHYTTRRHFHSCDKWDLRDAPDRRIRRLMEKENKKLRSAAKKEYNANLKELVRFVKKRDPRVVTLRELAKTQMEKEEKLRQEKMEEERQRVAAEQAKLLAAIEKESEKLQQEHEAKLVQLESQLFDSSEDDDGEGANEGECNDENESDGTNDLYCLPCKKAFKTSKQLQNHERSKKHKQRFQAFKREMLEAEDLFFAENPSTREEETRVGLGEASNFSLNSEEEIDGRGSEKEADNGSWPVADEEKASALSSDGDNDEDTDHEAKQQPLQGADNNDTSKRTQGTAKGTAGRSKKKNRRRRKGTPADESTQADEKPEETATTTSGRTAANGFGSKQTPPQESAEANILPKVEMLGLDDDEDPWADSPRGRKGKKKNKKRGKK